jgi:hypothetical protein
MLGNKTIYCSTCHTHKTVKADYGFRTCPDCRERRKTRYREKRDKKREQKLKARERQIEEQVKSGNLNYGLEPKNFMSWDRFKQLFKGASFKKYLEEKSKFQRDKYIEALDVPLELREIPSVSPDCERFRNMLLGKIQEDRLFMANHHLSCAACLEFYGLWNSKYRIKLEAVNLWSSEQNSEKDEPNELTKELYRLLRD